VLRWPRERPWEDTRLRGADGIVGGTYLRGLRHQVWPVGHSALDQRVDRHRQGVGERSIFFSVDGDLRRGLDAKRFGQGYARDLLVSVSRLQIEDGLRGFGACVQDIR